MRKILSTRAKEAGPNSKSRSGGASAAALPCIYRQSLLWSYSAHGSEGYCFLFEVSRTLAVTELYATSLCGIVNGAQFEQRIQVEDLFWSLCMLHLPTRRGKRWTWKIPHIKHRTLESKTKFEAKEWSCRRESPWEEGNTSNQNKNQKAQHYARSERRIERTL